MTATGSGKRAGTRAGELQRVAAAVGRVFRERLGRGPVRCHASWSGPDVMLVLVEGAITVAEETLRVGGHSELVLEERRRMQDLLEPDLCAAVESETQRSVRAFLGAGRLEPDVAAEVFLFEPLPEPPAGRPADPAGLPDRLRDALKENRELVRQVEALTAENRQAARKGKQVRESKPADAG